MMGERTAVVTYPDRISKPSTSFSPQDKRAIIFWEEQDCDKYHLRWWIDGEKPSELSCAAPTFVLTNLQPGCRYNIQVAVIIGEDEVGKYSDILSFQTAPKPPHHLQVFPGKKEPDTSFLIRFCYEQETGCKFKVFWRSLTTGELDDVDAELGFAKIEGLNAGDAYDIWVVAYKGDAKSESCKLERPIQTYPAKISYVSTKKSSPTSQTVNWDPIYGADDYSLKWKRCDKNYQTITTSETEQTLSNLDSGQAYKICVAAVNLSGTGQYSEPTIFTTDIPSPKHVQCKVIYTGDDATLEVTFASPDYQEIDKFVVTARSDTGEPQVIDTKYCHALISKVTGGSCYTICVHAVAASGVESTKVYTDPVWIRPCQVAMKENKAISGNSESVLWEEALGAESYIINVEEDGNITEYKKDGTKITLTNLTLNKRFSVSVAAVNQAGPGIFSEPISFMTALSPAEDIKISNIIDYPESGILVTWRGCNGASAYHVDIIKVSTNQPYKTRKIEKSCCYKFYDLDAGSHYRASIKCISDIESRNSMVAYSEPIWTYCSQVTALKATYISSNTTQLNWEPQIAATTYVLRYKPVDGNFKSCNVEGSEYTISNLDRGKKYHATVAAVNAAGEGKQSESISFRTGMAPPSRVIVKNSITNPSSCVQLEFVEPDNKPSHYAAEAIGTSGCHNSTVHYTERNFCFLSGLEAGQQYVIHVWSVFKNDEQLNSEKVISNTIWTCPQKTMDVNITSDSKSSRNVAWRKVNGATKYNVLLKKAGSTPVIKVTETNSIYLHDLSLNSKYILTVVAVNLGGPGVESDKVEFETGLHPPVSVRLENSKYYKTTRLVAKFEKSPDALAKKYQLRLVNLNGGSDKILTVSQNIVNINDLQPTTEYKLGVCSIHEKYEELNSEEVFSDPIKTIPPALVIEAQIISHNERKITWNDILNASGYKLYWRIEHGCWNEENICANEFVLGNLDPGTIYEVNVVVDIDGIPGEKSNTVFFITVSAIPKNLSYEILSTQQVKLRCETCKGADGYIFNINKKKYNTTNAEYVWRCEGEVNIEFTVTSQNCSGESQPSNILKFRQVVIFVQQNSHRIAANLLNMELFVPPVINVVPSGDELEDFRYLASQLKEGETNVIIGEHFSGKTACCSYITQKVSPSKLVIFLDYDIFRSISNTLEVKSLLHKFIPELPADEMELLFQWMIDNSDQVVFAVDNFALPSEFKPQNISYQNEVPVKQVFYNLLVSNRQLFPKSQGFCATSQDFMKQFLKCKGMKIVGFMGPQIVEMKEIILREKSEIELSDILKYFCTNPGFCQTILYWLKKEKTSVDVTSFSSVMINLLFENVQQYPPQQQKEKIHQLMQKIEKVPKRIADAKISLEKIKKSKERKNDQSHPSTRAPSVVSDGMSFIDYEKSSADIINVESDCDTLQDFVNIAIHFALFTNIEDFKTRLGKNSLKFGGYVKIWTMVAGLLREETMKKAVMFFKLAGIIIDNEEVRCKIKLFKKFIENNVEKVLKQIYIEPQITLEWFSCCSELNDDKLIAKYSTKVKITDKYTPEQMENVTYFIRHLPKRFFRFVKVKYEGEDVTKRLELERAIKENPSGKDILFQNVSKKNRNSLSRTSSIYQSSENQHFPYHIQSASTLEEENTISGLSQENINSQEPMSLAVEQDQSSNSVNVNMGPSMDQPLNTGGNAEITEAVIPTPMQALRNRTTQR